MTRLARLLLLVSALASSGAVLADGGYAVYRSDAPFEDVLEGLKSAIEERGLSINNVMDMSGMLERTGKDLGRDEPVYLQARSVEFCAALLSRDMTLENPARIVNCPFIISVYQRAGDPDITYVAHREIPREEVAASKVMEKVAGMLRELSEAAIAW